MISKILSTYWLRRILKHLKEKGLISLLKNTLLFLNKTFNPKYLGEFPLSQFLLMNDCLTRLSFDCAENWTAMQHPRQLAEGQSEPSVYCLCGVLIDRAWGTRMTFAESEPLSHLLMGPCCDEFLLHRNDDSLIDEL